MSTSAKTLPARASVEFLRNEARDLHHAFQAGEPEAIELVSTHLPRAGGLSADELSRFKLSRQEAQHALSCSYGLRKWEELVAVAEAPDLEALAQLSDRGLQSMLREIRQLDLVLVLSTLSEPVRERIFRNMSKTGAAIHPH